MNHVMFDLETLGTGPKSPIVQIAACLFNESGAVLREFNRKIDLGSDFTKFEPTIGTIEFWLKQSERARDLVFGGDRVSLSAALLDLNLWLNAIDGKRKYWSHATFDPPILMNAFEVMGVKSYMAFRDFMDIRTLNFLAGEVETKPREEFGEHHDAAADCRYQAHYVSAMMRKLKK